MVEEAKIFLKNLEKRYQKGDEFQIYKLMQEYALDLIGVIVLNEKFNAQSTEEGKGVKAPHGLLTAFQKVQDATNDRRTYSKRIFDFHEHYDMWAAKRFVISILTLHTCL